jgi:hypothetical protein
MKTKVLAALSLTLGLCAVGNAQADPLTSDTVVCGTTPGGPTTTVIPEAPGEQAAFLAAFCVSPVHVFPSLVNLVEADGSISDQLWTEGTNCDGFGCDDQFYFVSDNNPSTLLDPNTSPDGLHFGHPLFVVETGRLQDLSGLFADVPGTIRVQSDVAAVPEPATLLLVGSGLAVAARRRKRTTA